MPEIAGETGIPVDPENLNQITEAMTSVTSFETDAVQKLRDEKLAQYDWNLAAQKMKSYVDAMR